MVTSDPDIKTIRVYHFNNGSGGGVLSVIRNLLLYQSDRSIEHHVIYTINRDIIKCFHPPQLSGTVSEQVFYYSSKWNFYYTCKKAAQLLPDSNAVIVANDWLELGMVAHVGLGNPVIQMLHGDYNYYYQLSVKHHTWIDGFITVAKVMAENLKQQLPARANDIYYLPFPVPEVVSKDFLKVHSSLQIIFVGRLTRDKGYELLPLIEQQLRDKNVEVTWHIVGDFSEVEKLIWQPNADVEFYGNVPNEKVIDIMRKVDCFVLPSLAEGMPVTLVEAMKTGLACLVNDIPGGIQELIEDGVTGYKVHKNQAASYAKILEKLHLNRSFLQLIGENARSKANANFQPIINTARYEQLFQKYQAFNRQPRTADGVYGSRLDKPWIPNFITSFIRGF